MKDNQIVIIFSIILTLLFLATGAAIIKVGTLESRLDKNGIISSLTQGKFFNFDFIPKDIESRVSKNAADLNDIREYIGIEYSKERLVKKQKLVFTKPPASPDPPELRFPDKQ